MLSSFLVISTFGDKKFEWKKVKNRAHKRLTSYGTITVCDVEKGAEPCEYFSTVCIDTSDCMLQYILGKFEFIIVIFYNV